MFKKVAEHPASLVLSYSPFDQDGKEHPRVMTIENLMKIASKYFKNITTVCPGEFMHSKLNRQDKNFEKKTHGEMLLICRND